ncbi:hypothetical protein GCM10010136_06910 [Limoniibacter endophyticus]|uniref:Uncharacterized protein n=1 Tax=Limoniibacter endophyticus TaxID=1565040 RepID=A0A8J3GGG3_9HYPH|nr:hypothetical protein GCM10010136_06910 [Limoniibacter endophyticus]
MRQIVLMPGNCFALVLFNRDADLFLRPVRLRVNASKTKHVQQMISTRPASACA